jgi:hypothetical protein
MSKERDRKLRRVVCDGCSCQCRYKDFRAFGPYAGGFARERKRDHAAERQRRKAIAEARENGEELPHGNTERFHTGQQLFAEERQRFWKESEDSSAWVYRRKGKVLGSMHATKWQMWMEFIRNCPGRDEESCDNT